METKHDTEGLVVLAREVGFVTGPGVDRAGNAYLVNRENSFKATAERSLLVVNPRGSVEHRALAGDRDPAGTATFRVPVIPSFQNTSERID
jgi:hypothetical protein